MIAQHSFHAQKKGQCRASGREQVRAPRHDASPFLRMVLRSVLVSFGSTGRANRQIPPSQCQRSGIGHQVIPSPIQALFRSVEKLPGLPGRSCESPNGPASRWRATPRCFAAKPGGADRDRTDDLMLAKHALSQLSYGPIGQRNTENRNRNLRCLSSVFCIPIGGPGTS